MPKPKAKQPRYHSASDVSGSPDLAQTLHSYAADLLAIEQEIAAARYQKADLFDAMRDAKFDPAHAKAWVGEQMADPDKEAAKRDRKIEGDLVIEAIDMAALAKSRARARARDAAGEGSQDAASDYRQAKDAHDPEAHSSHTEGSGDGGHVRSFEGERS